MDPGGGNKSDKKGAESAPSDDVVKLSADKDPKAATKKPSKLPTSSKGVENAKKRLRAFSIQKKTISPVVLPKASASTNTTVIIGKLSGVKVTPKVEPDPEQKKLKPPKPGASRRSYQDSYSELQRRTLSEIEDMKRKMELVELGIPLGLICPTSTSEKAMPTKAMPPIKSFLDPAKLDELISEAKKAKQEGKAYKFNYQKLLPDYDNPFQKKREELLLQQERERKINRRKSESDRERERDKRKSDKYVVKRHDYKRDAKYKERDKDKSRYDDQLEDKETDVNLSDYLVCDSWSLENDDKNSNSSPKAPEKSSSTVTSIALEIEKEILTIPHEPANALNKNDHLKTYASDSPKTVPMKIEKLKPVMDSFKYEIDPNDEYLDIFDEDSEINKYAQETKARHRSFYDSPEKSIVDYELDNANSSMDGMNDDTFLESVINEIKQENISDDGSQDKALVEYELSPTRDEESPEMPKRSSVTPEIDDKIRNQSQHSDYSEGYRSSDSFKSVDTSESGYKSVESFRLSVEKELNETLRSKMSKSTVDSLETWSFVLKICQPLLFRHDKNKCYRETRTDPKLWYVENPKACNCVKDRSVVYEELEMLKMSLVDRVYGCDQIPDAPFPKSRNWYPRNTLHSTENNPVPLSSEWEAEDSQLAARSERGSTGTPQRNDDLTLDREYQRFMEAVWPDVVESKKDTSRSTTPIRQLSRKKKKEDTEKEVEEKKPKKIKLSSEGWSQESDMEEDDKSKKQKMEKEKAKSRKRKHSTSTLSSSVSETDEDVRKRRKLLKKKAIKQAKSKSAKRRRIGRKLLKKLKEKQNKKSKEKDIEDDDSDKKKGKKSKKRKQQKLKIKALKKKKAKVQSITSSSSSSSVSSDSDSRSDRKSKKAKKKEQDGKKKKIKKLRKQSSSDSTQSEDLFDVNILNNIKTERLTDDEKCQKMMDFSPRRQKPREIINVKELQNDFVENIHIKQEVDDIPKEIPTEIPIEMPNEIQEEVPVVPIDPVDDAETAPELKIEDTKMEYIEVPKVSPEPMYPVQEEVPVPEPAAPQPTPVPMLDESNMSQTSSQESLCSVSVKDAPIFYEKDESHLRPSSQNSNYSFNDVISASHNNLYHNEISPVSANQPTLYDKELEINVDQSLYPKEIEILATSESDYSKRIEVTACDGLYGKELDVEAECEDKYGEGYGAANYEMYEQMAMAYQSDVASQQSRSSEVVGEGESQRIETVVGARAHGEIKCDWRAGDAPATPHRAQRPSRWGLKPGEVNIVLTGGGAAFAPEEPQPVYHIQSLANRTDISTGYDEAYMDMYGASDRLQYGDCFGSEVNANITPVSIDIDIDTVSSNVTPVSGNIHILSPNITQIPVSINPVSPNIIVETGPKEIRTSSLDARINKALRETMLGGIAKEIDADKETPERGILVTSVPQESRGVKRVSFADGYKPGQDSDIEEPPVKKRKRGRRYGCAWPCPASHADHVPLWDALPPPPPPPGSPPPARRPAPPLHLLRPPPRHGGLLAIPAPVGKFDPSVMQGFMPPEPPPGLIALQ